MGFVSYFIAMKDLSRAIVIGHGGEAKFWIPSCRLVWSYNLNANQLKQVLGIIKENKQLFEEKWDEYFHRRTN